MVIDPDREIVTRLAVGDDAALGELMQRHLGSITSVARHLLGDAAEAEDIAQDVFIKAWKQAPKWQFGSAKYSTWLHRVCKNLCFDRLRKKKPIYTDTIFEIADGSKSALSRLIDSQTKLDQHKIVQTALSALPLRQRTAIILCHFENHSQKSAAAIMEISVQAYESLLSRGRSRLKKNLIPKNSTITSSDKDRASS